MLTFPQQKVWLYGMAGYQGSGKAVKVKMKDILKTPRITEFLNLNWSSYSVFYHYYSSLQRLKAHDQLLISPYVLVFSRDIWPNWCTDARQKTSVRTCTLVSWRSMRCEGKYRIPWNDDHKMIVSYWTWFPHKNLHPTHDTVFKAVWSASSRSLTFHKANASLNLIQSGKRFLGWRHTMV